MSAVRQIQHQEQQSQQDGRGQCEDTEDFVDFCPVLEEFYDEQIQAYAGRRTGGISDEVGDIAGTQSGGKLAEFQNEAEEEAGQDRFAGGDVQHFQIDAEGEEEDGVHQDFPKVEPETEFLVIVKRKKIDAARAGHFQNFTEREGVFEENCPYDEQAVEETQDVGEGEFEFGWIGHGRTP